MRLAPVLKQFSKTWQIGTLADGTIACWHPERAFPYEHSRPIDPQLLAKDREELKELRQRNERNYLAANQEYGEKGPKNYILREIFYANRTEFSTRLNSRRATLRNFGSASQTREMINAVWFGRRIFTDGLRLQEKFYSEISANVRNKKHYICLLEHTPTYTVGLRDQSYTPEMEEKLRSLGADFQRIKRGGLITFHGPGQLVAYPIIDLRNILVDGYPLGVRRYVTLLEEVLINVASEKFGVKGVSRTEDPGVWVDKTRKIAAIGIQVRNGITSHGIALNSNIDLNWFNHIVACGLEGKTVTSLSNELGRDVPVSDVIQPFVEMFGKIFQTDIKLENQFDQ